MDSKGWSILTDVVTMQAKEGWGQKGRKVHLTLQGCHPPLQAIFPPPVALQPAMMQSCMSIS